MPVVAMTAYAMKGDRDLCLSKGMDDYVSKPIQPSELYAVLSRLSAGKDAPVAAPAAKACGDDGPSGPVDLAEAMNRVAGDRALLRSMIGMFVEQCPKEVASLREALNRGDAAGVRRAAHTLKGTIGIFGR